MAGRKSSACLSSTGAQGNACRTVAPRFLVVRRRAQQLAPHVSDRLPRLRDEQVPRTTTASCSSSTRLPLPATVFATGLRCSVSSLEVMQKLRAMSGCNPLEGSPASSSSACWRLYPLNQRKWQLGWTSSSRRKPMLARKTAWQLSSSVSSCNPLSSCNPATRALRIQQQQQQQQQQLRIRRSRSP